LLGALLVITGVSAGQEGFGKMFQVTPDLSGHPNRTACAKQEELLLISDLLTYRLGKMPRNHAKDEADEAISFYIVAVFLGYSRCT
jgi:hypothetical protein